MGDIADDARNEYNMMLTLSVLDMNNEIPDGIDEEEWRDNVISHEEILKKAAVELRDALQQFKKDHPVKYFLFRKRGGIGRFIKKIRSNCRYWIITKKMKFHRKRKIWR